MANRTIPCPPCTEYFARRARALAPHVALRAFQRQVSTEVVLFEYAFGVHRRHLAGLSLDTPTAATTGEAVPA